MQSLRTTHQKVVLLRERSDLKVTEIASILGIPKDEVSEFLETHFKPARPPPRITDAQRAEVLERIAALESNTSIMEALGLRRQQVAGVRAAKTRGAYTPVTPTTPSTSTVVANPVYKIWNNAPFPVDDDRVSYLTLPDGELLYDAVIWKDFMQNELDLDPARLWRTLLAYPQHRRDRHIHERDQGKKISWIPGNHRALLGRNHEPIKRDKIWAQTDFEDGYQKYGYTGWQRLVSVAQHPIESIPVLNDYLTRLNVGLNHHHTHLIATHYKDQDAKIPFHSDKIGSFLPNSWFVVVKLGESRPFAFGVPNPKDPTKTIPYWSEVLDAGAAVFVRCKAENCANDRVRHAVPAIKTPCGPSGSIVTRAIQDEVSWEKQYMLAEERRQKVGCLSILENREPWLKRRK